MHGGAWTRRASRAAGPVIFTVLANAPGRMALAMRERQLGHGFATTLGLGLLMDVACLAPLVALTLAAVEWACATLLRRRASWFEKGVLALTVTAVWAVMWVASVGATEFRMQRGTYPSSAEIIEGLGSGVFVRGYLGIVFFERYSVPTLGALLGLGVETFVYLRRLRSAARLAMEPTRRETLGTVIVVAALAGGGATLLRNVLPGAAFIGFAPPLVEMIARHAGPRSGKSNDVRALLEATRFEPQEVRAGLHQYGFGDAHAAAVLRAESTRSCAMHPLSRPLPGDPEGSSARGVPPEAPTPLVKDLVALSLALFSGRDEPLTVWHVAIESFRADDVHALHDAAPSELTPFTDSVYASSVSSRPNAIAFRHAFQSGIRTAHAVSALTCGLGALPFQLALSRDLSDLPLRCLPDVLRDAGFQTRLFYGSDAAFENLRGFAASRSMLVQEERDFSPTLPKGAWRAVTDAALLRAALEKTRRAEALRYNFVLTLSGHGPFDVPEDMPPGVLARVDRALGQRSLHLSGEDRHRLLTVAYADDAVERWLRGIEATPDAAAHTIVVVSADHATADAPLWDHGMPGYTSAIPAYIYLPEALIAHATDPEGARAALRALASGAATAPISANDVPLAILALVSHHPALRRVPEGRRWHTLGGAATSPWFAVAPQPDAQLFGIDAQSRVFVVGNDSPRDTSEVNVPLSTWDEPLGPVLRGGTAALGAFLQGYASACRTSG